MGLTMKERKSLTRETAPRYRRADKKGKHRILDEFVETSGYNRKYAIHLLSNWGKRKRRYIDGKPVNIIIGQPRVRKKRAGRVIYTEAVKKAIRCIWPFFDYMCGKRLAVFIRMNLDVLMYQPELAIDETIREKLMSISPATIDRILAPERKKLSLTGRTRTRPGPMLKHKIPIRTFFDWDERKPGFFELDTVGHDGGNSSGEYCFTLNATDVHSGWVELRSLLNRAHRWTKEKLVAIRAELPFPLLGIDSDNGGEFINRQLWQYCNENHIAFTRGRAYHKNDNCFVEQKNDMAVRRTVGYYRFDTSAEYEALSEVYTYLCPLLNFFYPSFRIIEKIRIGAKVKKVYDDPKPPYQRLLESDDVSDEVKADLRRRAQQLHVVKQKRSVDNAVANLMRIYEEKKQRKLLE
tara:strand:+ start:148 stop:1371 length:1224 start_codon:yes stop_codon:yes gene_type:complete